MLLQIGQQNIITNILLGMKSTDVPLPVNTDEFRLQYQRYLKLMQPECFWLRVDSSQSITPQFLNPEKERRILDVFQEKAGWLDDLNQSSVITISMKNNH